MPYFDMSVLSDRRVRLELAAMLSGLINIVLTATTYWWGGRDEAYLTIVCACFILSFNYVLLQLISCFQNSWRSVKYCEIIFHLLAALLLLFQSVDFLIRTFGILFGPYCESCASYISSRILAVICSFLTSFIYGVSTIKVTEFSVQNGTESVTATCHV